MELPSSSVCCSSNSRPVRSATWPRPRLDGLMVRRSSRSSYWCQYAGVLTAYDPPGQAILIDLCAGVGWRIGKRLILSSPPWKYRSRSPLTTIFVISISPTNSFFKSPNCLLCPFVQSAQRSLDDGLWKLTPRCVKLKRSAVCSVYSVSQKKSPWGVMTFLIFLTNGWEFLIDFLHTYYTFLSTLDYKFLFKYLQLWQSYAILSATT